MAQYRIMVEETAAWQKPVLAVANSGTATKGNRYIVGDTPTGNFSTFAEHDIAWYDGSAWHNDTPSEGWKVYDLNTTTDLSFDGTEWITITTPDVSTKMDKVPTATEDNLASFNATGEVKDSGVKTPVWDADLGAILMEFTI